MRIFLKTLEFYRKLEKKELMTKRANSVFTNSEHDFFCNIYISAGIYIFKVNNRNTGTRCGKRSKLTLKTSERDHWCRSGAFIVNFEDISHLALVFLLLILSR